MKWYLLCLLVLLSPVAAQAGLVIFSDVALTDSTLDDNAQRVVDLYVVETGAVGNTGLIFSTEPSPGFSGVWLGDASPFGRVGSSPTGVSVGYGACLNGDVLVLTLSYQLFGTSSPCSALRIAPADGLPYVYASANGCAWIELPVRPLGSLHVSCPVATESTTWGKVKALYRR